MPETDNRADRKPESCIIDLMEPKTGKTLIFRVRPVFILLAGCLLTAAAAQAAETGKAADSRFSNLTPSQFEKLQSKISTHARESQQEYSDISVAFVEIQKQHALTRRDIALLKQEMEGDMSAEDRRKAEEKLIELEKQLEDLRQERDANRSNLRKMQDRYKAIVEKAMEEIQSQP